MKPQFAVPVKLVLFPVAFSPCRYEAGALAYVWPLDRVTLRLRGPFLGNTSLASAVLGDVSYPETQLVLEDLNVMRNRSAQPFRETASRRVRSVPSASFFASCAHAEFLMKY